VTVTLVRGSTNSSVLAKRTSASKGPVRRRLDGRVFVDAAARGQKLGDVEYTITMCKCGWCWSRRTAQIQLTSYVLMGSSGWKL